MQIVLEVSSVESSEVASYLSMSGETVEDTIMRVVRSEILNKKLVSELRRTLSED